MDGFEFLAVPGKCSPEPRHKTYPIRMWWDDQVNQFLVDSARCGVQRFSFYLLAKQALQREVDFYTMGTIMRQQDIRLWKTSWRAYYSPEMAEAGD